MTSFDLLHIRVWCWHRTTHHVTWLEAQKRILLVENNVQKLRWPANSLKFKSYRPLVGPTDMQGSCTAAVTKSRGAHACKSSEVCGHSVHSFIRNSKRFDRRHSLAVFVTVFLAKLAYPSLVRPNNSFIFSYVCIQILFIFHFIYQSVKIYNNRTNYNCLMHSYFLHI